MDVIGHHYPRLQVVARAVKESQRPFDQLSHLWALQMASAATAVQIFLELAETTLVVLNSQQSFPLGTEFDWKGVGETERDELDEAWFVAMRQVTALVPAGEAFRQ